MNYARIIKSDLIDGEDVRISLFVSGCSHGCKGCYNEKAWDYRYGDLYSSFTENDILESLKPDYIDGLSLLGGDPLMPKNFSTVLDLCKKVKQVYPNKTIWCWSGYTLEEIKQNHSAEILDYIDVLVDGKFEQELYQKGLQFRGSTNQRILHKGTDF